MANFPDVLKEPRALHLPLDAQIQKLLKCAERLRQLLIRPAPSSNSPSALLSAFAPPADALATCMKKVNKRRRKENARGSFPRKRVSFVDLTSAPAVP